MILIPFNCFLSILCEHGAFEIMIVSLQVRVWIMCLGFTCLFGALFSKTWRVHILFRSNQLKKKVSTDAYSTVKHAHFAEIWVIGKD